MENVTNLPLSISSTMRKCLAPITKVLLVIGGIATLAMLAITVANVIARKAMSAGVPGNMELVEQAMILVVFCTLAYTELKRGHVRVTFLTDLFPHKLQDILVLMTQMVTLVIVSVIGWQMAVEAKQLLLQHAATGVLGMPQWPFAAVASLAFILFSLGVLANTLEDLGKMAAKGSSYAWFIPGIVIGSFLLASSLWPHVLLPAGIGDVSWGGWAILLLFVLLFLGAPIGVCMGIATLWGFSYLGGASSGLAAISRVPLSAASTYEWSTMPMFTIMGILVADIGLAGDVYNCFYKLFGSIPGALASATTCACGVFAAMVGDSMSSVMAMSKIALPIMKTHHYDDALATGCIASGGTYGILIPPSLGFIIYGLMSQESIGALFMAGLIPGIILVILTVIMTEIRCYRNPALGPPGLPTTAKEKIVSLKGLWAPAILFIIVIGGLYMGLFTPTEAGAVGGFLAIIIGLGIRRLTVKKFNTAVFETLDLMSKMFFIFFFAIAFTKFLAASKIVYWLGSLVVLFGGGSYWITLILIIVLYFALGCVMNALPVLIMTLPVVLPLAIGCGYNLIWLGVLVVIMAEVGMLTPPVGMNVFGMASTCDVPMATIFKGVTPYWLVMLVTLVIIIIFPQISLWLPNLMYK